MNSTKLETRHGLSTSFNARDKKSSINPGKISNDNSSVISAHKNNDSTVDKSKNRMFNEKSNNLFHLSLLDPNVTISYKYELKFQELQLILLWFSTNTALINYDHNQTNIPLIKLLFTNF